MATMSGWIGSGWAASHAPVRPIPVTTSSRQIRNPWSFRRSSRPRQKASGGEYPGSAAALTGSQKKAAIVSGPASSRRASSCRSAASPLLQQFYAPAAR